MSAPTIQPISAERNLAVPAERLRLALAAGRVGVWELDLQDRNRAVLSPQLQELFGFKTGEFDGRTATVLEGIHPVDRATVLRAFSRAIRHRAEVELEFRMSRSKDSPAWLLARGRAYPDAEGVPARLMGVAIDITAQKHAELDVLRLNAELERRVGERTKQLEAISKELETFCYSVSHDLRAPLRSVRGFNEVLVERYASNLDARGQEFLRRACESSRFMDKLLENLLKLSRVGRAELMYRPVNLSQLASAIAGTLQDAEPSRAATFEIAPDLRASGDEPLLRIVLENLLSNAWKFTSKRAKASIEFGLVSSPEKAFFIKDNGAGFDEAYAGRLFAAFQRLHPTSEFEGTGIGLATVQRIINRHGGRVWAQGEVDRGATFFFALPADEIV